ncbi:hypothetical protein BDZ45DRAFT_66911 [Acephala macrosclerotiorum]|nr:hypothetical protein BDZ45DRAFT_66911 [Acephala macrosclerotiorum]
MIELPDFILDSYKRYKLQTQNVVTWLGQTGYRCSSRSRPQTHTSNKKNKKSPIGTTRDIPLKDFVPLARSIAEADPPVTIPRSILHGLQSVIQKRKKCAEWYSQIGGDQTLQRGNETHAYFVEVLEEVFDILVAKTTAQVSPSNNASEATRASFANSFSNLTVEDTFQEDDSVDVPSPTEEARPMPKVKYEAEYSRHEWLFEVYCFYSDFNEVRECIRDLWLDFKAYKIDLMNVSIVTDTAFDLLERAESQFRESIAPRGYGCDYLDAAVQMIGVMAKVRKDPSLQGAGAKSSATGDFSQTLCLPTYIFLERYLKSLKPGKMNFVPCKIKESVHIAAATLDSDWVQANSSTPELVPEDFRLLSEMIPWQEFIFEYKIVNPVQDKLCRGIYQAVRDWRDLDCQKPPPIWLVYATQIFLDIHHILKNKVQRGVEHLRNVSLRAVVNAQAYPEYTGEKADEAVAEEQRMPKDVVHFIERWVIKDIICDSRNCYADSLELGPTSYAPSHYYYENHPLLCGLMIAKITLSMLDIGIQLCNRRGCIIAMAHLYNAAQKSCYLDYIWEDMEVLIIIHDEINFFAGGRPVGAEDCLIGYGLAMGGGGLAHGHSPSPALLRQRLELPPATEKYYSLKAPHHPWHGRSSIEIPVSDKGSRSPILCSS